MNALSSQYLHTIICPYPSMPGMIILYYRIHFTYLQWYSHIHGMWCIECNSLTLSLVQVISFQQLMYRHRYKTWLSIFNLFAWIVQNENETQTKASIGQMLVLFTCNLCDSIERWHFQRTNIRPQTQTHISIYTHTHTISVIAWNVRMAKGYSSRMLNRMGWWTNKNGHHLFTHTPITHSLIPLALI